MQPDLSGFVFETGTNHTYQVANFTIIDTCIHALMGQQFDQYVLEFIEKLQVTTWPEPFIITKADRVTISRMEEIK